MLAVNYLKSNDNIRGLTHDIITRFSEVFPTPETKTPAGLIEEEENEFPEDEEEETSMLAEN